MIRTTIPLALAAAAIPAAASAEVQVTSQGPIVELSVTETVKAKPDIAEVSAGVTTDAPTAVAAMEANARAMDAVIARIKALGIAEDDIQTTGINLGAQYDYEQNRGRPVFRAYQASNRVSVTLRDVKRTGPVLDALVAAGATDIGAPASRSTTTAGRGHRHAGRPSKRRGRRPANMRAGLVFPARDCCQ